MDPRSGTKEVGKEKERDKHQGGGRSKVHAREEAGQRRVEESKKSATTTKEKGG